MEAIPEYALPLRGCDRNLSDTQQWEVQSMGEHGGGGSGTLSPKPK